jgi:flagellin
MSLRINHNIAALNGQRNLLKNDMMISKSLEKLSSGLRINRAADDAAGLIISEQMRSQITGLGQAISNSETAVNMVQTAEGALDEINTLLNKARELALHAANEGANDTTQLVADQSELDNIVDSVNRIASNTQFGTKKLLDGTLSNATSNNASVLSVKLGSSYSVNLSSGAAVKGYHTLDVTASATRGTALLSGGEASLMTGATLTAMSGNEQFQKSFTISIKGAQLTIASGTTKSVFIQQLNALGQQAGFTASMTGAGLTGNIVLTNNDFGSTPVLNFQFVSGASGATTLSAAETAGVDAAATIRFYTGQNGVGGTALSGSSTSLALTGNGNLLGGSGFSLQLSAGTISGMLVGAIDGTTSGATFQIGANVGQQATVNLQSAQAVALGTGADSDFASLEAVKGASLIGGKANNVLRVIDRATNNVTAMRGDLGAFQANTLESGLNSLRTTHENLTAAESTIRDVDFAIESANFTKNNILVQSATAMLAQANQLPQSVLKLQG